MGRTRQQKSTRSLEPQMAQTTAAAGTTPEPSETSMRSSTGTWSRINSPEALSQCASQVAASHHTLTDRAASSWKVPSNSRYWMRPEFIEPSKAVITTWWTSYTTWQTEDSTNSASVLSA